MTDLAFSGAGGMLQRDAAMRANTAAIAARLNTAQVLVFWRGKPSILQGGQGLLWLPPGHPLVQVCGLQVFLGTHDGTAYFAADLPHWQPQIDAPPAGFFDTSLTPHPDLPQGAGFGDLRSVLAQLSPFDGECAATAKALLAWHNSHPFCARCGGPSTATDAGWQRHCATCDAPHFPRTDPVVIMLVRRGDHVLLGRSPGWPEGMYSLLAGFVEPGEVVEAAVRREVAEETGVLVGDVRYLASQPWPFPANLMLGCVAEAISETITLDPAELEDAIWLSKSALLEVQLGRNPKVKPARKGAIAQKLIEDWLAGRID